MERFDIFHVIVVAEVIGVYNLNVYELVQLPLRNKKEEKEQGTDIRADFLFLRRSIPWYRKRLAQSRKMLDLSGTSCTACSHSSQVYEPPFSFSTDLVVT